MARIRIAQRAARLLIVISGRLTAVDMGRLEQACAPALTSDPLRLEIDLRGVTHTDSTAAALLKRMVARGAVLTTLAGELL
jgi:anti-anti-sigma regulatory factor